MRDGEVDRVDAGEIGFVHHVLATGAGLGLLAEPVLERESHRVERRDVRQAERAAAFLAAAARLVVDQRVEHEARVSGEILDDAGDLVDRADHRPEMADHLGVVELRKRRLGDHLERLAGRVGEQVEVEESHADSGPVDKGRHKPREGVPDKFAARFRTRCRHR